MSSKKLEVPTEKEINQWLNDIFSPTTAKTEEKQYIAAMEAFEQLTCYFAFRTLCKADLANSELFLNQIIPRIRIDYVGLTAMLKKFQRDAYGVKGFCDLAESLVEAKKLDPQTRDTIVTSVRNLGLRITAEEPRKTRIAAAFSIWMCVFRPVTVNSYLLTTSTDLEVFCGSLNFWIAAAFLQKFPGAKIDLGSTEEEIDIRLQRIKHDFTVREVGMSTMETLYSSIFRIA